MTPITTLTFDDLKVSKQAYDSALREMTDELRRERTPTQLIAPLSRLSPGLQRLWLDEADVILRAAVEILLDREIEVGD